MNWNGGTLPRASKNAKTSLSVVQKRHFAKVRGKLQNGSPLSPTFDFSIFEDAQHRATLPERAETSRLHRDHRSQRKLAEFGNVTPLSRRQDSTQPHHQNHSRIRSPLARVLVKGRNEDRDQQRTPKPPFIIPSSSRPSSASTLKSAAHAAQRSRDTAPQHSISRSIEAKRRELLCMRDWAGLNPTKPVHIRFADVEDRDLIGKRRRPEKGGFQGQDRELNKRCKTTYSHEKFSVPVQIARGSASPENISIRIGTKASRNRQDGRRHSLVSGKHDDSVTSEEMLLAEEFSERSMHYRPPGAYVHSQEFRSPKLATDERSGIRTSPFLPQKTHRSNHRIIASSAGSTNEVGTDISHSRALLSARSEGSINQIQNISPLLRRDSKDGDRKFRQEPPQDSPQVPTRETFQEPLQDEEKLWRDFVFGSDGGNGQRKSGGLKNPTPVPVKCDDGSSTITAFDFQEALPLGTYSLDNVSLVVAEASQHPSTEYPTSSSLTSILAEASGSPTKAQHFTSDCSSEDPLAWTPRRIATPKIVFQRPARYLGDQQGSPVSIHIGQGLRWNTVHKGRDADAKGIGKGSGRESRMARVLEDEIEDN